MIEKAEKNIMYNFDIIKALMDSLNEIKEDLKIKDIQIKCSYYNCHPSYYVKLNIKTKNKEIDKKLRFSDHNQVSGFYANEVTPLAFSLDVLAGSKGVFVTEQITSNNKNGMVYLNEDKTLSEAMDMFLYDCFYDLELDSTEFYEQIKEMLNETEFYTI